MGYWPVLERYCAAQHSKGLCGYPVNRWSTKRPPNGKKLDRWSTGGVPRPLGKPRSILRTFNTRSWKETRGVRQCMWECRIAKRTTGKMLGCMRRTCMQMQCTWWHDMRCMTWTKCKTKNKPDHEGNIITHSRKWQELELQIWKVTSRVLHKTSESTKCSSITSLLGIF